MATPPSSIWILADIGLAAGKGNRCDHTVPPAQANVENRSAHKATGAMRWPVICCGVKLSETTPARPQAVPNSNLAETRRADLMHSKAATQTGINEAMMAVTPEE